MSANYDQYFNINRETWNAKVSVHSQSTFYNLPAFKKGHSSLNDYETKALGNVSGKDLLHLQCHFGLDTLSWTRKGANCVGIDISEKAIALAQSLSKELELPAHFICGNVLDTSIHIQKQFDIVYTSYGVIGWLPDLGAWAQMISERLKPGGEFYMIEFHPIVWMFDYTKNPPNLSYGYQQDEVIYEEYQGTYAEPSEAIISREFSWNHGLGSIISALTAAGLRISFLREHESSPYDIFPNLIKNKNGLFETKDRLYPLLFELSAHKI